MTWEQKLEALQALGQISLEMSRPGDWYLSYTFERKEGDLLSSECVSNAKTPEEAVNQCWEWATDENFYIVIDAHRETREAVAWNGYRWARVHEEAA